MRLGYFLSSEEHPPEELVRQAGLAEQAGFESLWISDHFHPWLDAQGNSGFVWSIIGAISQACSLPVTTAPDAEYIVLARGDCVQSAQPTQIASLWPARMPGAAGWARELRSRSFRARPGGRDGYELRIHYRPGTRSQAGFR